MKAAVLVFPGSNCDRDMEVALKLQGAEVTRVWHKETTLPDGLDLVAIPGGFSYGDYLRCGAIAAHSPICREVKAFTEKGGYALGVCNGFQVLTETHILPGALMRNAGLKFICKPVALRTQTTDSAFTSELKAGDEIVLPVAHHDGNYRVTDEELARLKDQDRIAFRYADDVNGSVDNIAGVLSANRRVLGMMPHPERAVEPAHGNQDGQAIFRGLLGALALA